MDWPPASSFVLRCLSMVLATVIVGIGAGVAKRAIDSKNLAAMVGGIAVALAIVVVGYQLFSSGYFVVGY